MEFVLNYSTSTVSDTKKGLKMHIFNFNLPEVT